MNLLIQDKLQQYVIPVFLEKLARLQSENIIFLAQLLLSIVSSRAHDSRSLVCYVGRSHSDSLKNKLLLSI